MASSLSKNGDVELSAIPSRSTDRQDDLALAKLGKKAVLKVCILPQAPEPRASHNAHIPQRRFGFLSILGFSCTVLVTWEGSLV